MLLDRFPHPIIIAHRGASAHAPENTMPAFRLAVEQAAHALCQGAVLLEIAGAHGISRAVDRERLRRQRR